MIDIQPTCEKSQLLRALANIQLVREGLYEHRDTEDLEIDAPVVPEKDPEIPPDRISVGMIALTDRGLRVEAIVMNARDYADIRRWGRDLIDVECVVERMRMGHMAMLGDVPIIVSGEQTVGEILYVGVGDDGGVASSTIQVVKIMEDGRGGCKVHRR